ncbi:citrate/2-methylcitrate synthase [Streptomyces katsurahamanus]|uniref:citrate synthase (unknown stereospecificity) n=1 Tax=Streptomyces katsurahamanus TaxID=2577098 RepID=A0ABW9NME5_9ACTN|nr:citrate/2-methylcitrate synthase [Streptomyces katsurahamanus]MQS34433.1 helix-turn-helix domain-containing protein [Streptomyces katsurahamanus]
MTDQDQGPRDQEPTGGARLTTHEAAERLGVKPATLYAYVSRGQLSSRREPGGRGSTFDADDIDALIRRNRREPLRRTDATHEIRTGVTLIDGDRYWFRGVDAVELARSHHYEEIADWLWTGELRTGIRFTAPPPALAAARRAVDSLPPGSGSADRLRVAAIAAAVMDPLRFDLGRDTVLTAARILIPTLVDALPEAGPGPERVRPARSGPAEEPVTARSGPAEKPVTAQSAEEPIAARLWRRLTAKAPDEPSLRALDLALSLLIDHDLAASTLAVRVAASARAHPYAVVSAGLGALEGPLHGAASGLAHRMLAEVLERGSAAAVVADHLRAGRRVPGLGQRLYTGRDPRAEALFEALARIPAARAALDAVRAVEAATARRVELHANVDLALAALSVASGMAAEAGETVFAVARTAGWIAHALEEYGERPLRLRPTGHYTGPRPPVPLPTPTPHPAPSSR